MPTENVKSEPGKVFIKNEDGEMQELAMCEFHTEDNNDDAVDAMRYAIENTKGYEATATITMTKEESRRFQKMLGIQKIKRKRFIKLLMGCGIQKNAATQFANIVHKAIGHYTPMTVQRIIEWLIIQTEEVRKRNENRENKNTGEIASKQV